MDVQFLVRTSLFYGMSEEEIGEVLQCLGAETRTFVKDETVCREGELVKEMGLVLSGSVIIENYDVWGNRSVLDRIGPGAVFAETYACIPEEPMMVSAVSAENTRILFLQAARLMRTCSSACVYHSLLIRNLLSVTAQKNLNLSRRIFHTSSKSIRGRLLSYLSYEAMRQKSRRFTIPFNRQQLADYLNVDRSALSNELGKMQRDGLLTYEKNRFCLKEPGGGAGRAAAEFITAK